MSKVDTAMPPWKDITSISSSQVFLSVSQSLPCHRSIPDTKASSFLQGRTGPSMASVCFYPSLLPSNKLYFCLSRFVLEKQVCKAQNLSPVIALLAVLCSIFFFPLLCSKEDLGSKMSVSSEKFSLKIQL